jgi:hypothetical protein
MSTFILTALIIIGLKNLDGHLCVTISLKVLTGGQERYWSLGNRDDVVLQVQYGSY